MVASDPAFCGLPNPSFLWLTGPLVLPLTHPRGGLADLCLGLRRRIGQSEDVIRQPSRGEKHPAGASLKLLALVQEKGLEGDCLRKNEVMARGRPIQPTVEGKAARWDVSGPAEKQKTGPSD